MKKLSSRQIGIIEETLELNQVVFEDIKMEIIDHIASDIENISEENGAEFETVLRTVFEKWKPQFRPESNYEWLGNFVSGPKIALDKMVKYSKTHMLNTLLFSALAAFIAASVMEIFDESAVQFLDTGFRTLFIIDVLLMPVCWILILKTARKTSFSYLYKRRSVMFLQPLAYAVGFLPINFHDYRFDEILVLSFTYFFFFFFNVFDLDLVRKHLDIDKKLNYI